MRLSRLLLLAVLGLLVPIQAQAQETLKVSGKVVDSAGKPVAGADVAHLWLANEEKMNPFQAQATDKEGKFTLSMSFYPGMSQTLLAVDKDRNKCGLVVFDNKAAARPLEIKLVPAIRVHGDFASKELGHKPSWTNVYMTPLPGPARLFLQCSSKKASFSFLLPPGKYQFWAYGTDIKDLRKEITLFADQRDLDMRTIDMPATVIAMHKGKAPPAWNVTDARGVKKDVTLSDFKGKWVLVEFWGFW